MLVNHSMFSMFSNASLLVKLVMLVLLILSLVSWTVIFYRGSFLKSCRIEWKSFAKQFKKGSDFNDMYHDLTKHNRRNTGMKAIFIAGFKEFMTMKKLGASENAIIEAVSRAMNVAQSKELDKLERNISMLATIGSTSPYIGLFGTVWGIMTAFQALGNVQQATISMVAPGISEALIATAMGLFAAIPAVIAYNRYSSRIDFLANQYDTFREEFVIVLNRKLQAREAVAGVDYE